MVCFLLLCDSFSFLFFRYFTECFIQSWSFNRTRLAQNGPMFRLCHRIIVCFWCHESELPLLVNHRGLGLETRGLVIAWKVAFWPNSWRWHKFCFLDSCDHAVLDINNLCSLAFSIEYCHSPLQFLHPMNIDLRCKRVCGLPLLSWLATILYLMDGKCF